MFSSRILIVKQNVIKNKNIPVLKFKSSFKRILVRRCANERFVLEKNLDNELLQVQLKVEI